ncbi:venom protein D precursor [Nasonia vitripennis]|uniref:Uncharacterized protein n=1 Tax=Nasonia vitripennis TaxID=7425 RepID=A0A7M6UD03_NASVI|nr:venom protein D precursor [Nasonia vitripennis]
MFPSKQFFVFILLSCILYRASAGNKCSSPINKNGNITIDEGVIRIDVDRNEVQIYTYNGTKAVNILIHDVDIALSEISSLYSFSDPKEKSLFRTAVQGLAEVTDKNTLSSCEFDLKLKNRNLLNEQQFLEAKTCIESSLCNQIGKLVRDDYLRAEIDPRDFGSNSVLYHHLNTKYPNLSLPTQQNVGFTFSGGRSDTLQKTLNIIFDILLASIVKQVSGKELGIVDIPTLEKKIPGNKICGDGFFKIQNASIGDLKNIMRTQNFEISNDGLHFSMKFGLQIPHARVHLHNYNVNYCILSKSGDATLTIDSITLAFQLDINFNQSPCKTFSKYLRPRIEGVHFELHGGFFDTAITKVMSFVIGEFVPHIVDLLKAKLREVIAVPLEKLDCEKYRP